MSRLIDCGMLAGRWKCHQWHHARTCKGFDVQKDPMQSLTDLRWRETDVCSQNVQSDGSCGSLLSRERCRDSLERFGTGWMQDRNTQSGCDIKDEYDIKVRNQVQYLAFEYGYCRLLDQNSIG